LAPADRLVFLPGGIAGGAYFTAAIADNFGGSRDRGVVRTGYILSLLMIGVCGILLILDLGTPSRFLNMMMHFKFWDPMSIGAWMLGSSASSPSCPRRCRFPPTRAGPAAAEVQPGGHHLRLLPRQLHRRAPERDRAPVLERRSPDGGALPGLGRINRHGGHLAVALPQRDSAGEGFKKVKRADRFAIVFEMAVLVLFLVLLGSAAAPLTSGHLAPLFWAASSYLGW